MRRLFGALAAALIAWAVPALASPAIDGTTGFWAGCGTTPNTVTFSPLSTANTHDTVIVSLGIGAVANGYVLSISDTAGLTYTRRARVQQLTITGDLWEEWSAPAAVALTNDVITVTFQVSKSSGCYAGAAFGISGASWPVPFDPLFGYPKTSGGGGLQSFTTQGTDDLLLIHYGMTGCGGTPLAGIGWTPAVNFANGANNMVEYQVVSGAQTALSAPVGTPCGSGSIISAIWDAFVSDAGLGSVEQSSKVNDYVVLQTGTGNSKDNLYVIAVPGIGTSKLNAYAVTETSTTPASGAFGKGGLILHSFPP